VSNENLPNDVDSSNDLLTVSAEDIEGEISNEVLSKHILTLTKEESKNLKDYLDSYIRFYKRIKYSTLFEQNINRFNDLYYKGMFDCSIDINEYRTKKHPAPTVETMQQLILSCLEVTT